MSEQTRTFSFLANYGATQGAPITVTVENSSELSMPEVIRLAAQQLGVPTDATATNVSRPGATAVRSGDEVEFARRQGSKG